VIFQKSVCSRVKATRRIFFTIVNATAEVGVIDPSSYVTRPLGDRAHDAGPRRG
jgi:hypothetical protein